MFPDLAAILPDGLLSGHFAGMAAVVFGAALTQGIGGIGFAMVSAPISVLLFPELVPGPLLVLGTGLALLGAWRDFRSINWRSFGIVMAGRVFGTIAGAAVLSVLSATLFSVVFALLILIGVVLSVSGWKVHPTDPNLVIAGAASGVMGTITSSGAGPYAIVMQRVPPPELRGTMGCIFFAGGFFSLVMLAVFGHFDRDQFWLGMILFPFMIAGFVISTPLTRVFSREMMRHFLLGLAAAGSIGILIRAALAG
ncbi:MAG TPA: sulfite exporter TauE/SafE family protein [Bauldia sp.]|nr:sulfite exporter TauE/SafE family protein [Bauldia sp.]